MRAGDSDAVFQAHQLREHLGARDDGNLSFVGFDDFGIVLLDRRGGHNHVSAFDVDRFVAFVNRGAKILQTLRDVRRFGVRTRNGIAQRQQHFGNTAHADAADTYQVDTLEIAKRDHHGVALWPVACTLAASSIRLTISRVAFGRASKRAAFDCASIWSGWPIKVKISFVKFSAVSSFSVMTRPAPTRCISCALRNWWLSVAAPKGMKMAARPAAAISAAVMAPARQTITSAQAKRSAKIVRKGTTSALISRRA